MEENISELSDRHYETLQVRHQDDLLVIELARPSSANAINRKMMEELFDVCRELWFDDTIRYCVLQGGESVFSAGADLKHLAEHLRKSNLAYLRGLQFLGAALTKTFMDLPQIVISTVSGDAYGLGVALALSADYILMATDAHFQLPETEFGLILAHGWTPRLVELIGPRMAGEMIMNGAKFSAGECHALGLVNKVVDRAILPDTLESLVSTLRTKNYNALIDTKALLSSARLWPGTTINLEAQLMRNSASQFKWR